MLGFLFRASYLCSWLSQRGGEAAAIALGMGCGGGYSRNKRDLSPGKELNSHRESGGGYTATPASLERFFWLLRVWVQWLEPLASQKLSVHSQLLPPPSPQKCFHQDLFMFSM